MLWNIQTQVNISASHTKKWWYLEKAKKNSKLRLHATGWSASVQMQEIHWKDGYRQIVTYQQYSKEKLERHHWRRKQANRHISTTILKKRSSITWQLTHSLRSDENCLTNEAYAEESSTVFGNMHAYQNKSFKKWRSNHTVFKTCIQSS